MDRLITFSGVDGCGKSTQIGLLTRRLREDGKTPVVAWYRPGYSRLLDETRRYLRRTLRSFPAPGPSAARDRTFKRPAVRWAWLSAALTDALLHHALFVRTELARKGVVLADRWVWDATIDLQLRFPELGVGLERWMSWTAALAPRAEVSFLLSVSDRIADERQRGKHEPFPDSAPTAAARRQMYRQLAKNSNLTLIDADRNKETVHQDIWDRVCER